MAVLVGIVTIVLGFFITPTLILVNILITVFSIASGLVTPMTNARMMFIFKGQVSILSALMSGIRVAGGGILVLISTNIVLNTYWPLGIYTLLTSLLALACYIGFSKLAKKQVFIK